MSEYYFINGIEY